jgi:hypothetical protein
MNKIIALSAAILLLSTGIIEGNTQAINSIEKIEKAYYQGEIDYETALIYKIYYLRDLEKLPERFRSEAPQPSCGTSILLESWKNSLLTAPWPRPTLSGPEDTLITTHFWIHWTDSGNDSTTAEYVDSIAAFAEYCWEQQVDTMGWNSPPSDSFNPFGRDGGDYRYDIYVENLGAGFLGYVQTEYTVSSSPQEDATSYMGLDNNMNNSQLKATVSHEFNHSCQFGHSYNENTSWYENTATWMEDQDYDDVNDYYGYLSNFISNPITYPEIIITSSSGFYPYGGCIWPMYLHQNNGTPNIIRDIWALQGLHLGNYTMADIDSVLRTDYSSDQNTAMKEYAEWRYFAGPNDDGNHYEEGGNWGAVPYVDPAHIHTSYPDSGSEGTRGPDSLGVNFIRFDTTGYSGGLDISFNSQNGMEWAVIIISYDSLGSSSVSEMTIDGNGDGNIFVNWDGYDHIAMVPIVLTYTGTLMNSELRIVNSEFTDHRSSFTEPPALDPTTKWFVPLQTYTYNVDFVPSDSFAPEVTVIVPNGGENWSIGDTDTIQWAATDSTFVDYIDLFISTDNGNYWDTIAMNEPNDSIYLWTIPNTPSDSCLVRVRAVDIWTNAGEDTSDAVFSIGDFTPPVITVGFPNGGEDLAIGDTVTVTWVATDLFGIDSLTIEYSTSSSGWIPISSGETNDGAYDWTVPPTPSDSCLVRITGFDPSLNTGQDTSDSLFKISDQTLPAVTIIDPNGGESWVVGTTASIQWIASDIFGVDSLSLYLSTNGGGSWSLLSSGELNDSLFSLTAPCPPTDSALVRIVAYDPSLNSGEDTSDSLFLISDLAPPQVTVVFPNGSETFEAGVVDTIRWIATDNCGMGLLDLYLSSNGGSTWDTISVGEVNDSTYIWTIPSILSDSCLVRIISYDLSLNTDEDTSDGLFTITDLTPPQITVGYPNGGEDLAIGDTINIIWVATDAFGVDSLTLEYSTNDGGVWNPISSGETNDGAYDWTVPPTPSDSCLVRITGFDPSINTGVDTSDNLFRISDQTTPAATVIYPNGGEIFAVDDTVLIQWVAIDLYGVDSVTIDFSSTGGSFWSTLSSGEPNDSSFIWIVQCAPTDQNLIRVRAFDPSSNMGEDESDTLFSISDMTPPQVTLISPNGGETLEVGIVDTVKWIAMDNCFVDFLDLFLSVDGGTSWDTISTMEVNDSTFLWTVPNFLSDSCLVRIIAFDPLSNTDEDTSDTYFTIQDLTLPQVAVVYPNGGETFGSGDSVTITWGATDNGRVDSLSLFFSSNGGTIWDTLATGEANDSSYLWIVPGVPTTQGLIRILAFDSALNTGEDQSDSTFTIFLVGAEEDLEFGLRISEFGLKQNHPNPFHSSTTIRYTLPGLRDQGSGVSETEKISVRLSVYDITGRLVETLVDEVQNPGVYQLPITNHQLPGSGIYFYRLVVGDFIETRKMILLR